MSVAKRQAFTHLLTHLLLYVKNLLGEEGIKNHFNISSEVFIFALNFASPRGCDLCRFSAWPFAYLQNGNMKKFDKRNKSNVSR